METITVSLDMVREAIKLKVAKEILEYPHPLTVEDKEMLERMIAELQWYRWRNPGALVVTVVKDTIKMVDHAPSDGKIWSYGTR